MTDMKATPFMSDQMSKSWLWVRQISFLVYFEAVETLRKVSL